MNTESASAMGFSRAWQKLKADGLAEREVVKTLFRRNFINRFAGSGLGFAWVIIMPCIPIFIYNLLQTLGVFASPEHGVPRAVFLTLGLILYFCFSETLNSVSSATVNNSGYIIQSGVPKMAIILSNCVEIMANFVIRFAVFAAILPFYFGTFPWTVFFLPLFAVPILIFGLTIGLILNLFCVLYRDLLNMIQAITFYLLFASGVFTTIPDEGVFFKILLCSPVYQLITNGRNLALEGDFTVWPTAVIAAVICIAFLPLALVAFYRAEPIVNSHL